MCGFCRSMVVGFGIASHLKILACLAQVISLITPWSCQVIWYQRHQDVSANKCSVSMSYSRTMRKKSTSSVKMWNCRPAQNLKHLKHLIIFAIADTLFNIALKFVQVFVHRYHQRYILVLSEYITPYTRSIRRMALW